LSSEISPINKKGTKIKLGSLGCFNSPLQFEPLNNSHLIVNDRRYRGQIEVCLSKSGKILIINIVELEQYLWGVLKREISPSWPSETIKAQAIIARTFALSHLNNHKRDGYNLCSSWHCQVYGGLESEDKRLTSIVQQTKGLVLCNDRSLAKTPYHACCGGWTASITEVWGGGTIKYLRPKRCTYCKDSPHYFWRRCIRERDIRKKMERSGYLLGEILEITPRSITSSGRGRYVVVKGRGGKAKIKSNSFRLMIGGQVIRSTRFWASKIRNTFVFTGYGWGHGVGFCQWGGKEMGSRGFLCEEILRFYYPGVEIEDLTRLNLPIRHLSSE
jgi:stage II sporulation protein D